MFPVLGISRSFGIHLTEPNSSTMKSIILALALVAIAAALPVEREPVYPKEPVYAKEPVKILRSESQQDPQGSYSYNFETEDGSVRSETGELKEILDEENKPHTVVIMRGFYSYNDNLGNPQRITYFADDTGFHAEGDSIPKPVEPVSRQ